MTIFVIWFEINALAKFQRVMDWVLVIFTFAKCYIDDNIILNLILKDHMHHFQKVFN